jgi:hypothetical protein
MRKFSRVAFVILLVGVSAHVRAQTKPTDDIAVADFEPDVPVSLHVNSGEARIAPGDAAHGKRFLRLTPSTGAAGRTYLQLPLPQGVKLFEHERLTAHLRSGAAAQVKLTWVALDEQRHPIFQRRFTLEPGEKWVKLESPLRTWLWDTRRIADADEVRSIVLRIDSPDVAQVDLDDVRLEGRADAEAHTAWLLDLAFGPGQPRKQAAADGLMVATEAVDAFANEDLDRLLDDMKRTRAFVRRVFGEGVRPTDDIPRPAVLLIFDDADRRGAFLTRLGDAWGATIRTTSAQGFTVQDIATATYDRARGTRRPVYVHESAHAVVARDLRLLTGNPSHSSIQEGIANYVQLCVHPESIDRAALADAFAQPIDASGNGFFVPLEKLFATRATTKHYAQLATVVAYLVERDPPLLRDLCEGLADGSPAADVLARRGPTWNELQDAWLTWGRKHFQNRVDGHVFDPPAEFR